MDIAKGDYIAFVDSDDWLDSDMYETLIGLAEKYDADITIVDCAAKYKLTLDNLHYPVFEEGDAGGNGLEYSVYEDFTAGGRVVHTIRRGEFLVKNGKYQGEEGVKLASFGKQIRRKLPKEVK